jgi:hypothetical protein
VNITLSQVVLQVELLQEPSTEQLAKLLTTLRKECSDIGAENISLKSDGIIVHVRVTIEEYAVHSGMHKIISYVTKAVRKCLPEDMTGR